MRKLFDSKAGATYHEEQKHTTFCVRKECIELIYKLEPGIFMIVNLVRSKSDEVLLFTNWGTYFNRLQNPQVQMPKIEKNCKTLFSIMTGQDKDGVKELGLGKTKEETCHGFGLRVNVADRAPLMTCINGEVMEKFYLMVKKNITIYNELIYTPPFPAWKDGVNELWN